MEEEIAQNQAEVTTEDDTTIHVSYNFQDGRSEYTQLYFQDGSCINNSTAIPTVRAIGTYTASEDIAISISPYGKGWVGLSGTHIEADKLYCRSLIWAEYVHALHS